MQRLETGPALGHLNEEFMPAEKATEDARNWIKSWIVPEFKRCFPDIYDRETGKYIPKTRKRDSAP
jgi:hypothetical protein